MAISHVGEVLKAQKKVLGKCFRVIENNHWSVM